jgi:hypothetical protein
VWQKRRISRASRLCNIDNMSSGGNEWIVIGSRVGLLGDGLFLVRVEAKRATRENNFCK